MNVRRRKTVACIGEVVGEGLVRVPQTALDELAAHAGTRVHVSLTDPGVASALRAKQVTEEEISDIAAAQMESREQVIGFLLSEGTLKGVSRSRFRSTRTRGRR